MNQPFAGARRHQRLADLHRTVSNAVQSLHKHQLVVATALRGEDMAIQQAVIEEHRLRVAKTQLAVDALGVFVDRCRKSMTESDDGSAAILRTG